MKSRRSDPTVDVQEDERRRAIAGFILHAQLAGRHLPEHLGDMPDRMLVDRLARMDAKEVLARLQELYEVEWWTKEAFQRAFIEGAIQGWKPGALFQRKPNGLRVVSTTCPIAADVEQDPRLCEACRAIQKHAAYLALIGQVEDVRQERVMSKGESSCDLEITFRQANVKKVTP
jgi:hypothetical protein